MTISLLMPVQLLCFSSGGILCLRHVLRRMIPSFMGLLFLVGGISAQAGDDPSTELNPIGNRTVSVGQTLTFQVSGSDPEGDPMRFQVRPVMPYVAPLTVENHWIGNTHGDGSSLGGGWAISNFIEDMEVFNPGELDPQNDVHMPLIVTRSFWDETNWADGAYHNGRRVGKGEFFNRNISSKTATRSRMRISAAVRDGLSASIINFYGRAFLGNLMPPPIGELAPYVQLSDGRSIRSVVDPSAVEFDNQGRLWVADNGPDQNIKIFDLSAPGDPVQVGTFGDTGGIFGPPVRGRAGTKRFWGIRGIGFGANGEIFVGNTGIPMQTQGGTDIRAYNSSGQYLWDLRSIFMHVADIEPRGGNTVYFHAAGQVFEVDFSKEPGMSWKTIATSIDPFRFVDDPRLQFALGVSFFRVIDGRRFLFATTLNNQVVAVFRYEEGSEIAIPAALFWVLDNGQGQPWGEGKYPVWTGDWDEKKDRRLMWRDDNGNGAVDEGEFREFKVPTPFVKAFDVDAQGNVWMGGKMSEYEPQFREGGVSFIPMDGFDANGVPNYPEDGFRFIDVPNDELVPDRQREYITRIRYVDASDTLLLASGDYYPKHLHVYSGFRHQEVPDYQYSIDLGYDDLGVDRILLDHNSSGMTLPFTFAADEDYIYVAYLDRGLDDRRRGTVTVYRLSDGSKVGWFGPGAVTNHYSGTQDMMISLQVKKLPDGTRIICVEENGGGKMMAYRWVPGS